MVRLDDFHWLQSFVSELLQLTSCWQSWEVCVYYKETVAVQFSYIKSDQCVASEIYFKNKMKGRAISSYWSPSQIPHQFDNFLQSFEELLQDIFKLKSSFVLIKGNFN